MLFYLSIADVHTGEFVGVVIAGGSDSDQACLKVDKLLPPGRTCVSIAAVPLPVGASVPAHAVNRLLQKDELEALFGPLCSAFIPLEDGDESLHTEGHGNQESVRSPAEQKESQRLLREWGNGSQRLQ